MNGSFKKRTFSNDEEIHLETWVLEMEKYIVEWAMEGKDRFLYDCRNLAPDMFMELASRFKTKNPKFYVETDYGAQLLIVSWNGKNEC